MNNSDAIKHFNYENKNLYGYMDEKALEEPRYIYQKLAIQALEKQIPMKPLEIKERHNFSGDVIYKDGYCPDCKNEITSSYRFCTLCGQKLDWSDNP